MLFKVEKVISNQKREMVVPVALIVLSLIPVIAGMVRLANLARGVEITADNSRFFASPGPVTIHIISVSIFCMLGAFQFHPGFRKRNPVWHRYAGRYLVLSGIVAALSGLWMTHFYPLKPNLQGDLLYGIRILLGSAMVVFIILSLISIRKRDIVSHRAWIIRSYAIGQVAGTQALILIPWTLIMNTPALFTYEVLMGAAWLISIVIAEWVIRNSKTRKVSELQIAG